MSAAEPALALQIAEPEIREFKNPSSRTPLRRDFPKVLKANEGFFVLDTVAEELKKIGSSIRSVKRINIAWPQKHPAIKHRNRGKETVEGFFREMNFVAPWVNWVLVDAVYEKKKLERKSDDNQSSLYALTRKQSYSIDPDLQKTRLPFLYNDDALEPFVLIDDSIEQGTTMANLYSYLDFNGATVLAVAVTRYLMPGDEGYFAQKPSNSETRFSLMSHFNKSADNAGRIPELAQAFAESVKSETNRTVDPALCIENFENALKPHGHSIFTLTDQECVKIIQTVKGENGGRGHNANYGELLNQLRKTPPELAY